MVRFGVVGLCIVVMYAGVHVFVGVFWRCDGIWVVVCDWVDLRGRGKMAVSEMEGLNGRVRMKLMHSMCVG